MASCKKCGGSGTCPTCQGSTTIVVDHPSDPSKTKTVTCGWCNGSGACSGCNGSGQR